jgi:hypothetical protein
MRDNLTVNVYVTSLLSSLRHSDLISFLLYTTGEYFALQAASLPAPVVNGISASFRPLLRIVRLHCVCRLMVSLGTKVTAIWTTTATVIVSLISVALGLSVIINLVLVFRSNEYSALP